MYALISLYLIYDVCMYDEAWCHSVLGSEKLVLGRLLLDEPSFFVADL